MIAAAIIYYMGWLRADPVISFLIAGTIVWSAVRFCREAVDVLLEASRPTSTSSRWRSRWRRFRA